MEEAYLRFELSNFKAGAIQEILNLPHDEVLTVGTEIVQLGRSVHTMNNADPHVAYWARWTTEQYAALYNPKWTVNDLLSYDPARYHEVGCYVKYDVTLRFHGKVRTYSAVTLFRNPFGSFEKLKPVFWDTVVGSAGAFESLWYEQRPPLASPIKRWIRPIPGSPLIFYARWRLFPRLSGPAVNASRIQAGWITPLAATQTSSTTPSVGPVVTNTTEDLRSIPPGARRNDLFSRLCEAPSTTSQTCRVNFHRIYVYENGTVTNRVYLHRNLYDESKGTHSGPRGTPISCYSGYGVATKNCIDPNCTFAASLGGRRLQHADDWRRCLARPTCAWSHVQYSQADHQWRGRRRWRLQLRPR